MIEHESHRQTPWQVKDGVHAWKQDKKTGTWVKKKRVGENSSTSTLMRAGGTAVFPVGTEPRTLKIREMAEWDHLVLVCNYLISSAVTRAFIISQPPERVYYNKPSHWNRANSAAWSPHRLNCSDDIFSSAVRTLSHFSFWRLWNDSPKAKLISRRRPCFVIRFGLPWQAANCGSRSRHSLKETGWNGWRGSGCSLLDFLRKVITPAALRQLSLPFAPVC